MNEQLGLAPAYLGNGHQAYAAKVVAAWPAHNQARFGALLYTGEQLDAAVAAEQERYTALLHAYHEACADAALAATRERERWKSIVMTASREAHALGRDGKEVRFECDDEGWRYEWAV